MTGEDETMLISFSSIFASNSKPELIAGRKKSCGWGTEETPDHVSHRTGLWTHPRQSLGFVTSLSHTSFAQNREHENINLSVCQSSDSQCNKCKNWINKTVIYSEWKACYLKHHHSIKNIHKIRKMDDITSRDWLRDYRSIIVYNRTLFYLISTSIRNLDFGSGKMDKKRLAVFLLVDSSQAT